MQSIPCLTRWLITGGSLTRLLAAAPAQALTVPGPPTGPLRTTYSSPVITATSSAVVIAATDNRGNLDS
jgi:hypothetical protein